MRWLIPVVLIAVAPSLAAAEPTRLVLFETASREVTADLVVATLEGRSEAESAATAQNDLNTLMTDGLAAAEAEASVSAQTLGYMVRPYRRDGEPTRWIATQRLTLEGTDQATLLGLLSTLQGQGLAVQQLGGRLSDEATATLRDELTVEVLDKLQARAGLTAEALGLSFVGWHEISLNGVGPGPRPYFDAAPMAMEAARASEPVMTDPQATVSVTVHATALMEP